MKKLMFNVLFALGVSFVGHLAHAEQAPNYGGMPTNAPIVQAYQNLHKKLNLTPEQENTWKQLHKNHRETHVAHKQAMIKVHEALKAELNKTDPDFMAIQKMREDIHAKHQADQRAFYQDVTKFYATLNPTQKTMVREELKNIVNQMEQRHMRKGGGRPAMAN